MSISTLARRSQKLLSDNSPVILTGFGIVGTVATAVLVGRASYKAGYDAAHEDLNELGMISLEDRKKLDAGVKVVRDNREHFKNQVKTTWKLYLPSAITGVGTIAAIASANKINSGRTAALAAAYTLTDKAFGEYKAKVVETIGEKKEQTDIRDKVVQDRINETGDRGSLVVLGGNDVLCYDVMTDRYFNSTMDKLQKAQNDTNFELLHNLYVSLSDFYDRVGLPHTGFSDDVGWSSDNPVELHFSTAMSPDDRPVLAFTFHVDPVRGYSRVHG